MKTQRTQLAILFLTLLLINTGFGIILPILPYYAQNMGATASTLGLLSASYATLQFFFAPLWGRLSDRIGRKPVLLLGLVGFSLSFLLFGLADRLWMLFLARITGGVLSSATMPTALAFIADTTRPENRARGMGLMGAAGGLGMILGPAAGGFLAAISIQIPFFSSAALALLVAGFALLFLPESLSESLREARSAAPASSPGVLKALLTGLQGPIAFLMVLAAFSSLGMAQLESTGALYAEARFGLGEIEMGAMFVFVGVLGAFTQFFLLAPVIKKIGERGAIQVGLLGGSLSFILFGLARSYLPGILGVILMGLTLALLEPALNSLVSRSAEQDEQGSALGFINSSYSLGMMVGPITGGLIYDWLGMAWPFFTAAMIYLAILFVSSLKFHHPEASPALSEAADDPS